MCLLNIASILCHLGQHHKAHSYFKKAIRHKPQDTTILNNYAVFLEQSGKENMMYVGFSWSYVLSDAMSDDMLSII